MSGFEWTAEVRRTMRPDATMEDYVLGMISELGELADLLKRSRREGVPLDRARVLEEWGDILWYQEALDVLRIDLDRSDEVPDVVDDHVVHVVAWIKRAASRMLGDEVREWCDWSRLQGEARACCVAKLRRRYPDGFVAGVKVGRSEP